MPTIFALIQARAGKDNSMQEDAQPKHTMLTDKDMLP